MASDWADPPPRAALKDIWRDDIMGKRFVGHYGVTLMRLPTRSR